jgi:hypothetical protein
MNNITSTLQKKHVLSGLIILISFLFLPNNLFATRTYNSKQSNLAVVKNLPFFIGYNSLVLKIEIVDSKRLLRVSFNGSEGTDGELKLYNTSNEMVVESNLELIKSPFYATVDISSLPAGTYTAKLTTVNNVHTSSIIVQ